MSNQWRRWPEQARAADDNPFQVLLDYERFDCPELVAFNQCGRSARDGCNCFVRAVHSVSDLREV